ncbi:MAG TPA: ABC transporter permease [Vicinamibacterales bacterium]|nr:ABC transporter permease [Vicinamibacterales bacterium]
MLETIWQDVRYGFRLLRRSPLFTITAAASLAIGIGANTTIFSVASAMLLRPLPGLAEPERLVDIGRTQDGKGFDTTSYPNYRDVRERVTTLSEVVAYRIEPQPISLGNGQDAERIYGAPVTGNYFRALGTQPVRGRLFTDEDDKRGGPAVAVISYELWQRHFAGAADTVGRLVTFNGHQVAIIGITPPGFQGTTLMRADAWLPLALASIGTPRFGERLFTDRHAVWLVMNGRLKPGVSIAQANAELDAIAVSLRKEYPEANRGKGLRAMRSAIIPGQVDAVVGFLGLLLGIVALVLLAACVNLAGMMLARATSRRREIAVRLAIGANRGRLVRQLITETLILFAAGCGLGLLLTRWLTGLLLAVLPTLPVPIGVDIGVDWRVLVFAIVISFAAAILSALAPALQASRPDLVPALRVDAAGGGGRLRLRSAFIVAQVTISLVLVIAGALFVRALGRAASIDPGFDQANVDVVTMDLSLSGYKDAEAIAFASRLLERVRALPDVQAAAWTTDLPLDGGRMGLGALRVPGVTPPAGMSSFPADWNAVSPDQFKTLGIRLMRGRDFTEQDTTGAPGVIIINEAMARSVWKTTDVVGRQIEAETSKKQILTVVGVAPDTQVITLGGTVEPYVYVPMAQQYVSRASLLVKSTGGGTIGKVRALLRELNPNLPVTTAMPLAQVTALTLIPQRIAGAVAASLGVVVLLLAAIGLYGVTSYSVGRRTREIGIRMALGADRGTVLRLVIRQGLVLTAIGVALGLAAGAAGAQVLRSLLFGISALDPLAFGGAALLFGLVSLAASYFPARRATRVDPMVALRTE